MRLLRYLLVLIAVAGLASAAGPARKPNFVLINVDDMNGDDFLHAHPGVQTPYLDAFRPSAVTFPRAVCNAPSWVPSRASFLSGLHPYSTGEYLIGSDPWSRPVRRDVDSLPDVFRRAGHTVVGGGKLFHARITPARWAKTLGGREG